MKRFGILAGGLMACSLALSAAVAKAETLTVSTNLPPSHWGSSMAADPWMACVKGASNGEIDFKYFPSGQIAGFFESLKAVNDGLADIAYIIVSAQTDKLPLNGIPMLPQMGDTVVEMTTANRKALDSGGLLAQEFTKSRLYPLLINVFPVYQLLSRSEPFDTLEKINRKKLSAGGGSLIVTVNALGARAVEMSTGDVYLGVQQGTVDGSMLPLASVKPYKLNEVVKSMSGNGSFGSSSGIWSIDLEVWKKLSSKNQQAMRGCGLKVEMELAEWVDKWTEELKTEFKASGIKVYDFSPEAKAAIGERLKVATDDYINRLAARGLPAREAYEQYLKALGR